MNQDSYSLNDLMHRETVTHNTIDLLISLKDRFINLSWYEQRIILAIAEVITETPFEIASKRLPNFEKSSIYNEIDSVFEKFTAGLVKCRQRDIYFFLETFVK